MNVINKIIEQRRLNGRKPFTVYVSPNDFELINSVIGETNKNNPFTFQQPIADIKVSREIEDGHPRFTS